MSILQAFVLGLVQGITELLPISSSGFLILIPRIFGWELQPLAFDAILHLATLFAVVFALLPEIKLMFTQQKRMIWWIFFATIPTLLIGFLIEKVFQISFRTIPVVASSLIFWGIVLFVVDRRAQDVSDSFAFVGWKRSLMIGFAQVIALIPGTSRSGITMTAGMLAGLSRSNAMIFSFLLSIPVIAISGILHVITFWRDPQNIDALSLSVAFFTAFFTALITIRFLRRWLTNRTFAGFAIFRIVVGILLLLI